MSIDGKIVHANCLDGLPSIRHGFFTRQGGVSTGIYASLNCGMGSSDDKSLVRENRARVAAALGVAGAPVLTLHQSHTDIAMIVDAPFPDGPLPRGDALVTRTPGIVIGALAADCTPVLFADPEAGVIGAAHAGWRGALGGILESTIATMARIGARPDRIRAAVGPCINQPAYEVGPEFEEAFVNIDREYAAFFKRPTADGRAHFDLPGFVEHRLSRAGLAKVERQSLCTYENESLLFSFRRATHRKEPDYGRQISAIVLA
jgi:YfiH family protein